MNDFFKFTMQKESTKPARLDLFGVVGGGFWDDGFDISSMKRSINFSDENQPLDIYINSPGGSVFAGIAIHNFLKQHKGEIKIYVMGIAASAATLITSIPNAKVIMPTGSMLMVHGVSMSLHGAKAPAIKDAAATIEKIEQSIRNIYNEKTSLSEEELKTMMEHDTYMTAEEAVEKGFANEFDSSLNVSNSITDKLSSFNRDYFNLFANAPQEFLNKIAHKSENNMILNNNKKEGRLMTLEEMKAQYPEFCNAIKAEGIKEGIEKERKRIQAIEEMALSGYDEIMKKAKFESGITAEQMAVEMIKAEKSKQINIQKNIKEDASGLDGISNVDEPYTQKTKEEIELEEFQNAFKESAKGGK